MPYLQEFRHGPERDQRVSVTVKIPVHEAQYRAGLEASPYSTSSTNLSPVSPRRAGGQLPGQKTVSPNQNGGALPGEWPRSPNHGGGQPLPSQRPMPQYHGEQYPGEAVEYRSRKKSTGYKPASGGNYPPATHSGHYTTAATVPSHNYYQPQNEQSVLPLPEAFNRSPNFAGPCTQFKTFKIREMDDLIEGFPKMPAVLTTHDVYHEDWIEFIQDLTKAWLGMLPSPTQEARLPKRSTAAIGLVEHWNTSFFHARGVELLIYKGRERKNGEHAGRIDMDLPGFDITIDDSSSDSTEWEPQTAEAHDSRTRKETKRRDEEVERRLRALELRGKYAVYAVYLTCLPRVRA